MPGFLFWLQPASSTSSFTDLLETPWKIERITNPTPTHWHTIDIYTKDAVAVGYEARFVLLDQHGIDTVLLTGGARGNETLNPLTNAVLASFVPVIEEAARDEAAAYKGRYNALDVFGGRVHDRGHGRRTGIAVAEFYRVMARMY